MEGTDKKATVFGKFECRLAINIAPTRDIYGGTLFNSVLVNLFWALLFFGRAFKVFFRGAGPGFGGLFRPGTDNLLMPFAVSFGLFFFPKPDFIHIRLRTRSFSFGLSGMFCLQMFPDSVWPLFNATDRAFLQFLQFLWH